MKNVKARKSTSKEPDRVRNGDLVELRSASGSGCPEAVCSGERSVPTSPWILILEVDRVAKLSVSSEDHHPLEIGYHFGATSIETNVTHYKIKKYSKDDRMPISIDILPFSRLANSRY